MKYFFGLVFIAGGIFLYLQPIPMPNEIPLDPRFSSWVLPFILGFLGIVIVAIKPQPVAFRFGPLSWSIDELTRHVLITGDTGVGTSTSGLAGILVQICRNVPNWGGLILGVKGDEHIFARELCEGQGREAFFVNVTVRPVDESTKWEAPHRYNLVSDRSLPWTTHAKAIVDTAASLSGGQQHPFFKTSAQQALANVFQLLDDLGKPVTLKRAFEVLTNSSTLEAYLNNLQDHRPTPERVQISTYFDETFINAQAQEQKEGIIGTIKVFLAFFQDLDIANVFCSDEPNTFEISDVDHGMILAVSMPQRFQTERRYINTYLKTLFYYHALRRFDKSKVERENENLLLGVFDEFQGLVTAAEEGLADHNILDRVRAAKLAIIAGMQSDISPDPVIGRDKRKVLTLNMRTRLIFRGADMDGSTAAAEHIGKKKWKKQSRSVKGGFDFGVSRTITEQWDYKVQPSEIAELPDRTAYIVHPTKRHVRMKLPPMGGDGKVRKWK
jgi:hypothetical protein